MSPEPRAAVIKALELPVEDFFALDGAATTALQNRVAEIVQPPPSSGPPSNVREPLPELRAIGAPARVDWQKLSSFPLLLAEVRSVQREWEVHSRQNRLLMVSNLDTGAVDLMAPMDAGRRNPVLPPSRSGAPPDAFNAALSSIGVRHYDLLKWYSREQMQGRLALTVLEYDLPSNTIRVHVEGGPGDAPASGPRNRVDAQPTTAGPDGVSVTWPAVVRPGQAATMEVEVRLPRARVAVLESAAGGEAALAASLLLLQLDTSDPVLLHVAARLPPDGAPEGASDAVSVAFRLDLGAELAGRTAPGEWLAYLIVGETVSGPQGLRVEAP